MIWVFLAFHNAHGEQAIARKILATLLILYARLGNLKVFGCAKDRSPKVKHNSGILQVHSLRCKVGPHSITKTRKKLISMSP